MPKTAYQSQFNTKIANNGKVLDFLEDAPKRFSEIKAKTGFTDRGLTQILRRMENYKLIKHDLKTKLYSITNRGLNVLETADIFHITNRIQNDDGIYYHNYSDTMQTLIPRRMAGAVKPFIYIDKNLDALNLFSTLDVEEIEKLMFKKLSNSIRRNKLIEKNTGDIVLGFVIDYQKTEKLIRGKRR